AALRLLHRAAAHKFEQARFQVEVRFPQFAVVNAVDAFPNFRLRPALLPPSAEMTIVETGHLWREPRWNVHAIGDMSDGHAIFVLAGSKPTPHGARDFAVQRRDRVRAAGNSQGENSHAELFVAIAGVFTANFHQTIVREANRIA